MAKTKDNSQQDKRLKKLGNRFWRLNHLYYQMDEDGNKFLFKLNTVQRILYLALWWLNIIPKSRQHGITTFISLLMLDSCLFNSDFRAGLIAHKLADAKKILRDKIRYAYTYLPEDLKKCRTLVKDDSQELLFSNNSGIYVGTSMRSGTLQMLHISEYGWICTHMPAKAAEIKSGALETVHKGGYIFIEATAEGPVGDFPEMCEEAELVFQSGRELGPMDYKRHFFAWFQKASNVTDPKYVEISDKQHVYFDKLEQIHKITVTPEQRAWYTAKKRTLKHLIYKEHPSTMEEAFVSAVEGSYYAQEVSQAREEGRICVVPHNPRFPVHTVCDLGIMVNTPWIFFQVIDQQVRLIDCFCLDKKDDARGGMAYYKFMLDEKKEKYSYNYGKYFCPADVSKEEQGTGLSLYDTARQQGIVFTKLKRELSVLDGIERVTNMFPSLLIDSEKCNPLVKAVTSYRREWIEASGMYAEKPVHDGYSHYADAMRYLSTIIEDKLYVMVDDNAVTSDQIADWGKKYRRVG